MFIEYAGHAREKVKKIDLDEWYGIIIVSGDGLIFEVSLISFIHSLHTFI